MSSMSKVRRWWRTAGLCTLCLVAYSTANGGQEAKSTQPVNHDEEGYKIAGTVVNAMTGAPLARATVSLAETQNLSRMLTLVTPENGHFEFSNLSQAKFSLQGSRNGFVTSGYEQHEQYSTAIVTGPGFSTDNLVLRLMPLAVIYGHVFDESGDPVRSAQLHLYFEDHGGGMTEVRTAGVASADDRGFFDLGPLRPGTYYLSADAKPWYAVHPTSGQGGNDSPQSVPASLDVAYPTTFYGGATEAENASPIEVKGGDRQEVDMRLSPVPSLHLLFHIPEDTARPHGGPMPIFQKREFDSEQNVAASEMRAVGPGVYELTGLPAGRYDVRMLGGNSGEMEQFNEINLTHDGQDLSMTAGEALGRLKLTIKMAGEEPPPKHFAVGLRDARRHISNVVPVDATGDLSFDGIKPGKYAIVVLSEKRYAVTRAWTATGDVAGSEVNITPGANVQLTVEVAAGEAGIEGVAQKNGKPASGVMVALVPKDPETHVELFRRDQSDFDGTFLLRGVIPGTYTIVAIEDAWGFDWLKSGVLARYAEHSQTVVVRDSMRGTIALPQPLEVQPR
jgi:5-hydroxyisourate hydrolase-like protein (transthyretin family)